MTELISLQSRSFRRLRDRPFDLLGGGGGVEDIA